MTKFDFSDCFLRNPLRTHHREGMLLGPCSHCGDDQEELLGVLAKSGRAYGILRADQDGYLIFCSPSCIASCFVAKPDTAVAWLAREVWFPPENRIYWTHNGCEWCKNEDEQGRFVKVFTPCHSKWGNDDREPCFCSPACLVATFHQEWEEGGLDKWGMSTGLLVPHGPLEDPHRAAKLKRLRRKLRPRELARIGF